ncbi:MAG: acylneuraminate cytidylyltransferase family protein [Rhodospirillaceae bacterium]|jgi:N-acylneuraminate cytidylyltransferase|nr:acylneuraminate cytidylyltransferase family protein [Rhodospirillaceae bacterium]MBT3887159.1 acylneuraminate cytidylyltransferase family protein [Rhodospirillaceae bacterium]MBT4115515.1 acylneuraminate cytidylyltransferase family protein [Rhodospirillaceae bacterium]MBT4673534.1 acylneuraminate cytidylyltransferase family protein [Rhodospirillaceae bacterium]MBT4721711.1 acylneuraminate cytidylyltransferase family protein [Rhodospirillaceae bacterium]
MTGACEVIALIQARGGSKGVAGKNIRDLGGHPLLAWSVAASNMAQSIERTILSTDSEEIAAIGSKYGAEVPFMRPAEFSSDTATDYPVIRHAIEWLRDEKEFVPEFVVQIRPTTPLRDPALIDMAVARLKAAPDATGLRSVFKMPESAWKNFEMQDGYLMPLGVGPGADTEAANNPRQGFAATYTGQGYVDVVRSSVILEQNVTYGDRVIGFETPDCGEVDVEADFRKLEFFKEDFGGAVFEYLQENYS